MKDLLTSLAISVGTDPNSTTTVNIPTASGDDLLANGLNLMYFLAGTVSVIVIIIAGIMYVSSSGDAGRVTKAKNLLMYAVVGLVVVLVAFIVTNFIIARFK
jgi:hypothetical protein